MDESTQLLTKEPAAHSSRMRIRGLGVTRGIRRAWAVVSRRDRRRLRLVALYGVLISGLDTLALILLYALMNLLDNQPTSGVGRDLIEWLQVGNPDRYSTALLLLVLSAALFVLRSALSAFGLWLAVGAANESEANLISRLLFGHAGAPQITRLERNTAETLRTVIFSVDQVVFGIVSSSVALVANAAIMVAVAAALFVSSPLIALTLMVYFGAVAVLWAHAVRGMLERRGRRVQHLQEERYRLILQGLSSAKELQLRGRSLFYARAAVARTRGINAANRGAYVANGSLRYLLEASLIVGVVAVALVADFTGGRTTVLAALGLVLAGAFRVLPALNQILFLTNQVQYNTPAIDVVQSELATFANREADDQDADAVQPLRFAEELRLEGVGFRYPTRREPALRDVSLVLEPGVSLGIIGSTGSGKSTLLDIILGMLEPDAGRITIDGTLLIERRDEWQRSIGYVPQDVYLVDDTLAANVALGWRGADIDAARVAEAIALAELGEVVAALPEGLETVVGERGVRLSGGQRQRVGLARALYTRPTVLVLDEATSNLDQTTERRIVDTLDRLRGGLTIIMVTHRLASVRRCDHVLLLQDGMVAAAGTLDDVQAALSRVESVAAHGKVADAR